MRMPDSEICREYRLAKDRWAQIQILAEQNMAKRLDIINILLDNGEKIRMPTRGRKGERSIEQDDGRYYGSLYKRLDALDGKIYELTEEYMVVATLVKRGKIECQK